jgi:plastocyanin
VRATAFLAGLLLVATSSCPAAAVELVSINIVDAPRPQEKWGYAPATRRIQPNTWVTWSNNGQDAHTVTALDGSFDSGNLDPSDGFSWFFDQPGTFEYVCALHTWMTGKIVVGNGIAPAPPPPPDPTPAPDPDPQSDQ